MLRISSIKLPIDYDERALRAAAAAALGVSPDRIRKLEIKKRSLDARKKPELFYVLTVDAEVAQERKVLAKCRKTGVSEARDCVYRFPEPGAEKMGARPVIAGCGPAGLFCGLLLARMGYRPILLERGEDVDARAASVEKFWNTGVLDTRSNVQFGEGGAGTFSDGKLNTLVKDREGRGRFVLETFVRAGADPDILYVNKPHIGTDVLRAVVKNLRAEIEQNGGEVRFLSQVTDLDIRDGRLAGITVNGRERLDCRVLVLAIGHSARDTFAMLNRRGIPMEAKSFAVGLRIEHPQRMIDRNQYGGDFPDLPAADYKLTAKTGDGRGVYSFCMCPGGYVVNASSEENALAVNGMSYRARDARNANSALIVTVTPQDFASMPPLRSGKDAQPDCGETAGQDPGPGGVLAGVEFQRRLEAFAWRAGQGRIPVQLLGDFRQNIKSDRLGEIEPCCRGAWAFANLREGLPGFLSDGLLAGISQFDRAIAGFSRPDALLLGVESRTSSPVRIRRGEDHMSAVGGLYPCGEGAGYAGGIMSAAMDGLRTAEAVIGKYRKF